MSEGEKLLAEAARGRTSLAADVLRFLGQTKKWWLAPIIASLILLGVLAFLGSTAAAPFIYTLF